jgi:transposase
MSFMDKVKQGMDKAKGEVSDLAATTKIRHDISNLNDRKSALFSEIGRQVYALSQQGHAVSEVEAQCREIAALDQQIKEKSDEIARINAA